MEDCINLVVNCPFLCLFISIIYKMFPQWKTLYKPHCDLPIPLFVYLHYCFSNGRLHINLIVYCPFLCLFISIIYKTFPQWKTSLYINLIVNCPFLCLFTSIIYKTFLQWKTVYKPHCELPISVCLPPLDKKRFSNGRLNINLVVNCPFLCLFISIIYKTFPQWKTLYKPHCELPISLFVYLHYM